LVARIASKPPCLQSKSWHIASACARDFGAARIATSAAVSLCWSLSNFALAFSNNCLVALRRRLATALLVAVVAAVVVAVVVVVVVVAVPVAVAGPSCAVAVVSLADSATLER
jgi:hypothetical protein